MTSPEWNLQSHTHIYIIDSHRPYNLNNIYHPQIFVFNESVDEEEKNKFPIEITEEEEAAAFSNSNGEGEGEEEYKEREGIYDLDDDSDEEEDLNDNEGDLFDDDNNDEQPGGEGEGEGGADGSRKRKRKTPKQIRHEAKKQRIKELRERDRREWDEENLRKRQELRESYHEKMDQQKNYYNNSYYGAPASLIMYRVSRDLTGKLTNEDLWLGMIGLSDLFLHEKIGMNTYLGYIITLKEGLPRFNLTFSQLADQLKQKQYDQPTKTSQALVVPIGHIAEDLEWRFMMLNRWNLYESIKYSNYSCSKLQTWTEKGEEKIRDLLTHIGIKTSESKHPFLLMNEVALLNVDDHLENKSQEDYFNMTDLKFPGFTRVRKENKQKNDI